MKCMNCNHKLPKDSEFCQYCGSKIEIATDDIEGNTSDISVTCEEEASDNFERIDVDNMSPEEALGVFFGAYAKQSGEAIDANAKSQPNHEDDADFGLIPEKPIYTLGTKLIDGETEFLSSLRTSAGEKIKWERRGSLSAEGVNGIIDIYDIYLHSGQLYKTIYINMYGAKRSSKAPAGFMLNDTTSPKPTKTKKEKKIKTKYCSCCGTAIDRQTKVCTGCGKKYFKIRLNKFSVAIIILSAVIVALASLNIFQYLGIQNLKKEFEGSENHMFTQEKHSEFDNTQYEDFGITTKHIHSYIVISQTEKTCDANGKKEFECETCGHKYTETIYKSHSYSAATCTTPKKCTVCNKTYGEPLGHTDGAKCSRCGEKLFENLQFSGNGRKVIKNINLPRGTYVITAKSSGTHNFIAWYHKSISDNYGNLMANSIGKSEEIYTVEGPCKDAYIEITESDGPWTIDIELYE